jgi:hypothetical protein
MPSRVLHAAEHRARAANAPLPSAAHSGRATGQAAAAALQGSGSGSEPMPPPPAAGQTHVGVLSRRRRLRAPVDVELAPVQAGQPVRTAPWTSMTRRRSRRGLPGQECSRRTARGSFGSSAQPSHGLAQPPHRGRQQCEPVVRRGKQPPPLSRPRLRLRLQLRVEGGLSC